MGHTLSRMRDTLCRGYATPVSRIHYACVADPPPQGLFLISLLFFLSSILLFKEIFSYLFNNNG